VSVDNSLPELLHHYTDHDGLIGIVESKALWATHIGHLNDETEIRYVRELMGALAERIRQEVGDDWAAGVVCDAVAELSKSETSPDTFVASLCEDGDNLSQWRGYGKYAIGIDREMLFAVANTQNAHLIRLMYEKGEQEAHLETVLRDAVPIVADWAADPGNAPPAMQQLLLLGYGFVLSMLLVKNPYFRDEREWRLDRVILPALAEAQTRIRKLRGVDTPYEQMVLIDKVTGETPIVEVVLGPKARSDESVAEVRELLDRNGLQSVSIRKSMAPLRD
jgi:DUF2971 family protein